MYKDREKQLSAQREHYRNNKQKYFSQRNQRKRRNKEYVHAKKKECITCGEVDSCCLDFHHKESETKNSTISQMIGDATSLQRLDEEIEKCEVLCANCHVKRHRVHLQDGSEWNGFEQGRIQKRRWFIEFLKSCNCVDCKESDSRCLEFDHLRGTKKWKVSYLLTSGHSIVILKNEIEKCDVVCANCHRKRHWKSSSQVGIGKNGRQDTL